MRIFIDTSALFKKYVDESGSEDFEKAIRAASELAVSPVTRIEVNAVIERRLRDKSLLPRDAERLEAEVNKDYAYFHQVLWNENLETKSIEIVRSHGLRSLDAIQLASGVLSESDAFITSDRRLYLEAKKILKKALII